MRPKQRVLEFAKQHVTASKRALDASAEIIQFSSERMAAAQKAIKASEAREKRHRERHEKKAA